MPIERRSRDSQIRAVLIGVVALVFALTLGYALFQAATGSRTSSSTRSAGRTFLVGRAESLATEIDKDGPILLPDASGDGQNRPVFVWHPPDTDAEKGWTAFEAVPPSGPDDCFLTWDDEAAVLSAPCTSENFPPDGEGLTPVPVEVDDDGRVIIDLATDSAEPTGD
jgi:hypothetical protein